MQVRTRIAAAAAAAGLALAGGAAVAAAPAMAAPACAAPQNCTNGTVNVGSTLGATGFPTAFTINTQAGVSGSATASPYGIVSNVNWKLNFGTDPADDVLGSNFPAQWYVAPYTPGSSPTFGIPGTTTITHLGSVSSSPLAIPAGNGTTQVLIDQGGPTNGGTQYADTFTVTPPALTPPGAFSATFVYVLSAA